MSFAFFLRLPFWAARSVKMWMEHGNSPRTTFDRLRLEWVAMLLVEAVQHKECLGNMVIRSTVTTCQKSCLGSLLGSVVILEVARHLYL